MLQTPTNTEPEEKAPDNNKHLSPPTPDPNLNDLRNLQTTSGPPSPTISHLSFMSSMSWIAEKSTTELVPMLKNAYTVIKDKEKDLVLAAELGKSLLDYNMRLKSKYDSLLTQQQQTTAAVFSTASTKATTATTSATCAGTFTPPITPSTSTQDNGSLATAANKNADSIMDLMFEATENDDDDMMKFIPSFSAREAMIEVLERKNTELAEKLDAAIQEKISLSHSQTKRNKQLEMDIQLLRSNLEIATAKIEELQELNERQKKHRMLEEQKEKEQETAEQTILVDELILQVGELQMEKEALLQSKSDLETKLVATLQDLFELKQQFQMFECSQRDMEELQKAYEKQFQHIDELNHSLEEHRTMLQKLKDKGVQIYSPTPSQKGSTDDDCGADNRMGMGSYLTRNSLLDELGSAWRMYSEENVADLHSSTPSTSLHSAYMSNKDQKSSTATSCDRTVSALASYLPKDSLLAKSLYRPTSSRTNSNIIVDFESVLSKATGIDRSLIDDALQFIDEIEKQHRKEKYLSLLDQQIVDDSSSFKIEEDGHLPAYDLYPNAMLTALSRVRQHEDNSSATTAGRSRRRAVTDPSVKRPSIFLWNRSILKKCILSLFHMVWRWCRFAIVLTIALFISAAKGPESLSKVE